MSDFSQDIKLALWKNDKRTKPTQPILKGGKPQEINGQEFWVSAWINAPKGDDDTAERIGRMIDLLAQELGSYPIVTVSLSPAEEQSSGFPAKKSTFDDEIPF